MDIFIGKQLEVIVYSLILGLIFGGLYDIIRIIHILCGIASYSSENAGMKHGKLPFLVFFLCDAVYMLTITAIYSVFLYWQMNGIFRLFVLLSVVVGFILYHNTAGRVVMFFSEAIVRFLRLAALWVIIKPVQFLIGIFKRALLFLYHQTVGRFVALIGRGIRHARSERIKKSFKKDIYFTVLK